MPRVAEQFFDSRGVLGRKLQQMTFELDQIGVEDGSAAIGALHAHELIQIDELQILISPISCQSLWNSVPGFEPTSQWMQTLTV